MAVRLYCANEDGFLTGSRWFYEYAHNKNVTLFTLCFCQKNYDFCLSSEV